MVSAASPQQRPLDVFLVAGEISGDLLGAALMRKLRERAPGEVRFRGVGGPAMAEHGLVSQFPMDDVAAMGFAAVVRKLPLILRRIRETAAAIVRTPPDIVVLIDSPDFNQRVAKRVRRALPKLPIVKYVSPTVWVWRPGRARKLKPLVDHILALFPFEPEVHRKLGGPPTSYVGHPLLARLAELRPSADEARARVADPPLVLVLPGSRRMEISRLAPVFGEAIGIVAAQAPVDVVVPTLPSRLEEIRAVTERWPVKPRIVTAEADKYAAFRRARAALAASGTVTLELGLSQVPMVAAYKVPMWEETIVRMLVNVSTANLVNLIVGEVVVPEFLQRRCTPETLAAALAAIIADSPERRRQLAAFARLDEILAADDTGLGEKAAQIVLKLLDNKR